MSGPQMGTTGKQSAHSPTQQVQQWYWWVIAHADVLAVHEGAGWCMPRLHSPPHMLYDPLRRPAQCGLCPYESADGSVRSPHSSKMCIHAPLCVHCGLGQYRKLVDVGHNPVSVHGGALTISHVVKQCCNVVHRELDARFGISMYLVSL